MNSPALPFDAVLFDLGSTLIYFDGDWPEVIRQSDSALLHHLRAAGFSLVGDQFPIQFRSRLSSYHAERDTEFIEYTTGYILRTLLAEWGYTDVSEAILRPALASMYTVSQSHWQPEVDALPTILELKRLGYRLGLISNASDDADVRTLVKKARLQPHLEVVLSSAAQGIRKPNPRIFHQALEQLGVQADRAVMVGDMLGADILGAHLAGMKAIWITRRADTAANRAHEDTIQPDAVIHTLIELPAVLNSL